MPDPAGRFTATPIRSAPDWADHRQIGLSPRDSAAFAAALLDPPPASDRLRETAQLYRRAARQPLD